MFGANQSKEQYEARNSRRESNARSPMPGDVSHDPHRGQFPDGPQEKSPFDIAMDHLGWSVNELDESIDIISKRIERALARERTNGIDPSVCAVPTSHDEGVSPIVDSIRAQTYRVNALAARLRLLAGRVEL